MTVWQDAGPSMGVRQRTFVVRMETDDGRVVRVKLQAGCIENVIDQVRGRRIVTPDGMVDFSVSEVEL